MATFLKTFEGVDISVEDDGRFTAMVDGRELNRRTLADLERAIAPGGGWPGLRVFQVEQYGTNPHLTEATVYGYRRDRNTEKWLDERGQVIYGLTYPREFDEALASEMREALTAYGTAQARVAELEKRSVRLTPERLTEARRATKAGP